MWGKPTHDVHHVMGGAHGGGLGQFAVVKTCFITSYAEVGHGHGPWAMANHGPWCFLRMDRKALQTWSKLV